MAKILLAEDDEFSRDMLIEGKVENRVRDVQRDLAGDAHHLAFDLGKRGAGRLGGRPRRSRPEDQGQRGEPGSHASKSRR